jgi:hypothetical protein
MIIGFLSLANLTWDDVLQSPSDGNSQDAPLLTNGLRKCSIYTEWNSTQP